MDIIHRSLASLLKLVNEGRRKLASRLKPDEADGQIISGYLTKDQVLLLRPAMIEVNSLIENLREHAKRAADESKTALELLNGVLKEKLGLAYKLEIKS